MNAGRLFFANFLIASAMICFGLWVASSLEPNARLPIHWNARGDADSFAPAAAALLWPAGASALFGLLFASLPSVEPFRRRLESSTHLWRSIWIGTMFLMFCLQLMIAALGLGWQRTPDFLLIGLGALMVLIGDTLPKSRPNFFVGIRTPWTLGNTDIWIATHRFGGKIMLGAGCVTLLMAFLPISPEARAATIIFLLVIPVVVPTLYSWMLWQKGAQ